MATSTSTFTRFLYVVLLNSNPYTLNKRLGRVSILNIIPRNRLHINSIRLGLFPALKIF